MCHRKIFLSCHHKVIFFRNKVGNSAYEQEIIDATHGDCIDVNKSFKAFI